MGEMMDRMKMDGWIEQMMDEWNEQKTDTRDVTITGLTINHDKIPHG